MLDTMDAILSFDSSILLWIQNSLRADFISPVVKVITHLGDKGIFWIALTLVLLAFKKTRRLGVLCGVSMVIGLLVTNLVIKNWVARVRPYELMDPQFPELRHPLFKQLELIIGKADDWSFPSGHTTNSLACAWVLFRRTDKKWGVPALVLAILIALSRLYVGIHYPTDVLGGAVIGIGSACLSMWLVPKLERRFPVIKRLYRWPRKKKGTRKKAAARR